jgi:hypothetical protein
MLGVGNRIAESPNQGKSLENPGGPDYAVTIGTKYGEVK